MNTDHGYISEDTLEKICCRIFDPSLVVRSPILIEKSGDKELADILIIVDDIALIFQSKSLKIGLNDLDEIKMGRISKRHSHAKQQLNTALNAYQRKTETNAVTLLDIPFSIDWTVIRKVIGIVTLNIDDEIYSDPEYRFQFPELLSKFKNIEVHTFILRDLWEMTKELSTAGDFLQYLRIRKQCVDSNQILIGNELDLLGIIKTEYPELEKMFSDNSYNIMLASGIWERYQNDLAEQIQSRKIRQKNSWIVDKVIDELRASVSYTADENNISKQESAIYYLRMIGKLSKLTRLERTKIGNKIHEKIEKTKIKRYGYFIHSSLEADISFLFLFLNEDDRGKRRDFFLHCYEQACHKIETSEIVGVASNGAKNKSYSFDYLFGNVVDIKNDTKESSRISLFGNLKHEKKDEWDT